jgi:hypothetical protein
MVRKFVLMRTGTDVEKSEIVDYARSRDLSPSIDGERVFRRAKPTDTEEMTIDVTPGAESNFDIKILTR